MEVVQLRLPREILRAADALVPRLTGSREGLTAGRVTRSAVLRAALARGLDVLAAELGGGADDLASDDRAADRDR